MKSYFRFLWPFAFSPIRICKWLRFLNILGMKTVTNNPRYILRKVGWRAKGRGQTNFWRRLRNATVRSILLAFLLSGFAHCFGKLLLWSLGQRDSFDWSSFLSYKHKNYLHIANRYVVYQDSSPLHFDSYCLLKNVRSLGSTNTP